MKEEKKEKKEEKTNLGKMYVGIGGLFLLKSLVGLVAAIVIFAMVFQSRSEWKTNRENLAAYQVSYPAVTLDSYGRVVSE